MISHKQEVEILNKIKAIMEVIWESSSIKEISNKTKISTSSIQRYLNNSDLLRNAEFSNEDNFKVKNWLLNSKLNGLSKGGRTTQKEYGGSYIRKENGKFSGISNSRKKNNMN